MRISTIEEAFKEIEKKQEFVPIEAIEFLYNHEQNEKITNKIVFSLENAYNDNVYFDKTEDYFYPTPLWYSIVAENHLSEELVHPIISLYTSTDTKDWDYLNEQGIFLVGKISKKLREKATKPFLDTIEKYSKSNAQHPTLFLHECLFFVDHLNDLPQILRILENEDYIWIDSFAIHLAHAEMIAVLPRLKEILDFYRKKNGSSSTIIELEVAIKELETGISEIPKFKKSMFEWRGNWKKEYENFYKEEEPIYNQIPTKTKKIGRNEPCPCGSGKKYKKCCLN